MVVGMTVFSENQAIEITKVDGKVDYILVDAEKKIANKLFLTREKQQI